MLFKLKALTGMRRNVALLFLDFLLIYLAYVMGMYFRYGIFNLYEPEFFVNGIFFSLFIVISLALNGTYKIAWSYSYFRDYWIVIRGIAIGFVAGFGIGRLLILFNIKLLTVPFTVSSMAAIGSAFLIIWSRIMWLSFINRRHHVLAASERVLIVGAGDAGTSLAEELAHHPENGVVVGFVDDSPRKLHRRIRGIQVLGDSTQIMELVEGFKIDKVIVAIPSADSQTLRKIFSHIDTKKIKVQTLPSMTEIIDGKAKLGYLREIDIEDLLGRESVKVDLASLKNYIVGRVVLVTGAGGSIGSELCKQIAPLGPGKLLLLGKGENSIYEIKQEISKQYPDIPLKQLIGDVQDKDRMEYIFKTHRPSLIFHAAAHKHVPLMEENPTEAFRVNSLGSLNIALMAHRYSAEAMVMISTDKAINPSSIMGVSKRLAEEFVRSIAENSATRFGIVRFGNVLGSRGSVIPLFKKQIQSGGPVTVTDPRMTRYFMTIPEAVSLVLQAGAYATGGDIFVLDMGEPVKISTLAREMITLAGYVPEQEIMIEYTGARPGEKLFEELVMTDETLSKTKHPKIFKLNGHSVLGEKEMEELVSKLELAIRNSDYAVLNGIIEQFLPDATARIKTGRDFS
ncbi:putative polysaccharide biosynthesis protein EpsC [Mesotoga infera]|uniref:Putative polysaccharide biosynthesis protein EpsC n=1 Tax=Mesotoga infera TaxID=1236046 RepID=A0A7Z7LF97_9BACT|nr:nucleoside-diphosphate sugar epimerase/dehydratase [Mesotoga infera]SSC13013.1 putative polysaccharide biosynthesis protein EpsC [Mesotoga infera]